MTRDERTFTWAAGSIIAALVAQLTFFAGIALGAWR
jgi:hypothetical protein